MSEQWAPFATRLDGPRTKHGYPSQPEPLPKLGTVYHSMEGYLEHALRMLADPNLRKSWTLSNPKEGPLLQHYPMDWHTWANGSRESNVKFVSCENEGVEGEALTDSQVDNLVELTVWLAIQNDWPDVQRLFQLWEHNEMTRFGSAATACPSDRIPWQEIQSRTRLILNQEDDMRKIIRKKGSGYEFAELPVRYYLSPDMKAYLLKQPEWQGVQVEDVDDFESTRIEYPV